MAICAKAKLSVGLSDPTRSALTAITHLATTASSLTGKWFCPGDFVIGTPETGYTAMHPDAFAATYALDHDS